MMSLGWHTSTSIVESSAVSMSSAGEVDVGNSLLAGSYGYICSIPYTKLSEKRRETVTSEKDAFTYKNIVNKANRL